MVGIFEKIVMFYSKYLFGVMGSWDMINIKLQIAQTHAAFNVSNTLIQLPMVAVLAWIVTKLIPGSGEEDISEYRTKFIDKRF